MSTQLVVNVRSGAEFDVYIGRDKRLLPDGQTAMWGNPFSHLARSTSEFKVATRQDAVEAYRHWLWLQIRTDHVCVEELATLAGKTLGCHCAPAACHGEVLVDAAAWAVEQLALRYTKRDLVYPSHFRRWAECAGLTDAPRVVIAGSREFAAADVVREVVAELQPGTVVIEGEARGADRLAAEAALARGLPLAGFPADWKVKHSTPSNRIVRTSSGYTYDAGAGFLRNRSMIACEPERVIALADDLSKSKGTRDTVKRALDADIPVVLVGSDGKRVELLEVPA